MKSRFLQWFLISLILLAGVGWYFRPQTEGAVTEKRSGDGLVGYWSLDDGDGTTATDLSGNSLTGTLQNMESADWVQGVRYKALDFDGVNEAVTMGTNTSLELSLPLTMSAWIKADTDANTVMIMANDSYNNANRAGASMLQDGPIQIGYGTNTGCGPTTRRSKSGNTAIVPNTWYHVVGVIRGATDMDIYLNGVDDGGTYSGSGGSIGYSSSNGPSIGSNGTSNCGTTTGAEFDGIIDDVRFYNRSLSSTEVTALYQLGAAKVNTSQNNMMTTGLVGLWSMDGADVVWGDATTEVKDRSGNSNHGNSINQDTTNVAIGKVGQGLDFNGSDEYVDINDTAILDPTSIIAFHV